MLFQLTGKQKTEHTYLGYFLLLFLLGISLAHFILTPSQYLPST